MGIKKEKRLIRGFKILVIQRAKTASESDSAKNEPQKLNGNERDQDSDTSTSPKSNEASHSTSGPQVSLT